MTCESVACRSYFTNKSFRAVCARSLISVCACVYESSEASAYSFGLATNPNPTRARSYPLNINPKPDHESISGPAGSGRVADLYCTITSQRCRMNSSTARIPKRWRVTEPRTEVRENTAKMERVQRERHLMWQIIWFWAESLECRNQSRWKPSIRIHTWPMQIKHRFIPPPPFCFITTIYRTIKWLLQASNSPQHYFGSESVRSAQSYYSEISTALD